MVCLFYALSGFALSYATISPRRAGRGVLGARAPLPTARDPDVLGHAPRGGHAVAVDVPGRARGADLAVAVVARHVLAVPADGHRGREGRRGRGVPRARLPIYDPPLWTMHNELRGSLLVFAVLLLPAAAGAPRRRVRRPRIPHARQLPARVRREAWRSARRRVAAHRPLGRLPDRLRAAGSAPASRPSGCTDSCSAGYPAPSANRAALLRPSPPPHVRRRRRAPADREPRGRRGPACSRPSSRSRRCNACSRPRSMRFLGRISFALYLLHFLVLGSLGAAILIALARPAALLRRPRHRRDRRGRRFGRRVVGVHGADRRTGRAVDQARVPTGRAAGDATRARGSCPRVEPDPRRCPPTELAARSWCEGCAAELLFSGWFSSMKLPDGSCRNAWWPAPAMWSTVYTFTPRARMSATADSRSSTRIAKWSPPELRGCRSASGAPAGRRRRASSRRTRSRAGAAPSSPSTSV